MKTTIAILMLACATAFAQDKNVVPNDFVSNETTIENFGQSILNAHGFSVAAYPSVMLGDLPVGSKATDRYGFGLAAYYPVAKYAYAGLRLDYISGNFWATSATLGARYTVDKLPFRPTFFTVSGLGIPLEGAGNANRTLGVVNGLGVIVNIKTWDRYSFDAFIEGEKATNLPGETIHFGAVLGVKF